MGSYIGPESPPILYGNLVSSVSQLEDLQGNMGLFFLFPDVSIRSRGRFQLGISLVRISRSVILLTRKEFFFDGEIKDQIRFDHRA